MPTLQYYGLKGLQDKDQAVLNTLATRYASKFERYYENASTRVTIRRHNTTGTRQKITISVVLNAPKMIAKAQQADWDCARAAHKAFQNVENELKKIRKLEMQRKKQKKF